MVFFIDSRVARVEFVVTSAPRDLLLGTRKQKRALRYSNRLPPNLIHEDEIRSLPQLGCNASPWSRRKYKVVLIGRAQLIQNGGFRLGLHERKILEELVDILPAVIATARERKIRMH